MCLFFHFELKLLRYHSFLDIQKQLKSVDFIISKKSIFGSIGVKISENVRKQMGCLCVLSDHDLPYCIENHNQSKEKKHWHIWWVWGTYIEY